MGMVIGLAIVCLTIIMWAALMVEASESEKENWIAYIETVCEQRNICPELVEAMIEAESSWNPNARNGSCVGLMQVSENWHQDRMKKYGVTDLTDPYDNILIGVDYLHELFEKYGAVEIVLAVYHGEKDAVEKSLDGYMSEYTTGILERSAELERLRGK